MIALIMLVKKEFLIDFRQKYPIAGIVLYIFSTIYISYLAFNGIVTPSIWNALLWIILLFSFVTGLSKSFIGEEKRSLYYYFTISPNLLFSGKLIYYTLYGFLLVILVWGCFQVFLPFPSSIKSLSLFILNLMVGSFGLSSAFTMISSIASRTSNPSTLMAVLGFPVIIPVLLLAVTNSRKILLGATLVDIQGNLTYMISVIVIIIAVSFILFPYSSRN
jgi:heme exporter protein B